MELNKYLVGTRIVSMSGLIKQLFAEHQEISLGRVALWLNSGQTILLIDPILSKIFVSNVMPGKDSSA